MPRSKKWAEHGLTDKTPCKYERLQVIKGEHEGIGGEEGENRRENMRGGEA